MEFFYFFLGMAGLQVVFTCAYYVLFRKKEFLYYTLFTVFFSAYVVLVISLPTREWIFQLLGVSVLGVPQLLVPVSILFYYKFIRHFIEAPFNFNRLNRHFLTAEKLLLGAVLTLFFIRLFLGSIIAQQSFVWMMFLIVPLNLYLLVQLVMIRQKLSNIIAIGSFLLFLFARFAVFASLFTKSQGEVFMDAPLAFSIGGILLDFVFFDFALIYKTQLVYKENLRLAVEKQEELNQQRMIISNDLHDDIGSSLSSIQLELALAAQSKESEKSLQKTLLKVSEEVKGVLENMNDIIWAVKKSSDKEKTFSNRIKDYFFDLMDARQINCTYEIDKQLELTLVSSTCRKNLLLITKEALNNALKHSEANQIVVKLFKSENLLHLEISDNGKGIPDNRLNVGNGLESMRLRSLQMGGTLEVERLPDQVTRIACKIPLGSI